MLLVASSAMSATTAPRATMKDKDKIRVALPAELLREADVQKDLRSGLTTTFIIRADAGERHGGARIELRYELWDEVYLARAVSVDGTIENATLPDTKALTEWWSAPHVTVLTGTTPDTPLQLRLDVLPFSASEEADAKRWLAQAASGAPQRTTPTATATAAASPPLLDAVIGTSVRRKPLLSYVWRVKVTQGNP